MRRCTGELIDAGPTGTVGCHGLLIPGSGSDLEALIPARFSVVERSFIQHIFSRQAAQFLKVAVWIPLGSKKGTVCESDTNSAQESMPAQVPNLMIQQSLYILFRSWIDDSCADEILLCVSSVSCGSDQIVKLFLDAKRNFKTAVLGQIFNGCLSVVVPEPSSDEDGSDGFANHQHHQYRSNRICPGHQFCSIVA